MTMKITRREILHLAVCSANKDEELKYTYLASYATTAVSLWIARQRESLGCYSPPRSSLNRSRPATSHITLDQLNHHTVSKPRSKMDDGELKKRGEASSSLQASRTAASLESARRFLYDEDEPPPPANVPVSPPTTRTTLSASQLGGSKPRSERLNAVTAAFMATLTNCRNMGTKRLLVVLGGATLLALLIFMITSLVGGESHSPGRMKQISNKVISAGLTSKSVLKDKTSPQYHALSWLANVDDAPLEGAFLLQRYALAVLFYSTSGATEHVNPKGGWFNQLNWMTDKGYCTWNGIECLGRSNSQGDKSVAAIKLPDNSLTGTLPAELVALDGLVTLDLTGNALTSTLPPNLSELTLLNFLLLGKNELQGTIPESYGKFFIIREMDVGHNELRGTVPASIYSLSTLRKLGLDNNEFGGAIPDDVKGMEKITSLYLQSNAFTGPIPDGLLQLTTLIDLRLSDNRLTGSISPNFAELYRLEFLHMSDNKFVGSIPEEIFSRTTRLVELSMANNQLNSTLPSTFGSMGDLKLFSMARNHLTGSIPRQLSMMLDLETFSVEFNKIGGTIPELFVTMKDLSVFNAHNNLIVGTLPTEFGALRKLTELHVSQNRLNGNVPTELGYLKALKTLRLNGNQFTGTVPEEVCTLVHEVVLVDLTSDCTKGSIKCACCSECF